MIGESGLKKKESDKFYRELLKMEPFGFIDPLQDLGTFDSYHMCFLEPVEDLRSHWSGDPYLPFWQDKIAEMRQVYLAWQKALVREENIENGRPTRNFVSTQSVRRERAGIIRVCMRFGFSIKNIARKTGYAEKTIRNEYAYSRHMHSTRKNSYVIVKNNGDKVPFDRYLRGKEGKERHWLNHQL